MTRKNKPSWMDVAVGVSAAALLTAVHGQEEASMKALRVLATMDSVETPVFATAITYWVDALRSHMFDGQHIIVKQVGVSTISDGGREYVVGSAEADMAVPAECIWASNMVDARLAHDLDRFLRLWDAAPEERFGDYVIAVLNCVSETIKANPRGWALAELREM